MNAVGFHIPNAFDKVLAIEKCWLQEMCIRDRSRCWWFVWPLEEKCWEALVCRWPSIWGMLSEPISEVLPWVETANKPAVQSVINIAEHQDVYKRQVPFCQHYGVCGGCKWQVLPYSEQIKYKQKQVTDNLTPVSYTHLLKIAMSKLHFSIKLFQKKLYAKMQFRHCNL